jgi:uncharacterized repeat protein (TIGR02543 family)
LLEHPVKLTPARATTALAVMATAGVSTVFVGASPAFAASEACGNNDGVLVSPGICELSFTSGTSTFTPTAEMTKLEVLLVGAGGSGAQDTTSGYGTSAAGGGGEVKIVDFTGTTDPLNIVVATPGITGSVTSTTTAVVQNGASPSDNGYGGGSSGSGFSGSQVAGHADFDGAYGAGGGAGGAAVGADGGAGVVIGDIAPAGSLFTGDTRCFGGGGGIGSTVAGVQGLPGCGGGGAALLTSLVAPAANSGGSGGSVDSVQPAELRRGADGIVIVRWAASDVTLTFDAGGHGTAPASQTLTAGATPTTPAAPTETGFVFEGWFADAPLTTPANFSAPVTAATTFYAKWSIAQVAVSLDVGAHGAAPAPFTVDYGTAPTAPVDPADTGMVFEGWYTDATLTTAADLSLPVTTATVFYAKWSIAQATVSFDTGARGTAPAAVTVDYGTAAARPADPTAAGYVFAGWYTDAALTTRADFTAPITASVTLYAAWTAVVPTADDLAATGYDASPLALAGPTLLAGLGLALVAGRRRRRHN